MTKLIQAMSFYDTEDNISCLDERHNYTCKSPYTEKFRNIVFSRVDRYA